MEHISPGEQFFIDYMKKQISFDSFWTPEDDDLLREEILHLRRELLEAFNPDGMDDTDINTEMESLGISDCEEDIDEVHEDYILGVDHGLNFNLDNAFYYISLDFFLFWVTFFFILLCGNFFFCCVYYFLGIHMALQAAYNPADALDTDKTIALTVYCTKVFYLIDKIIDPYIIKPETDEVINEDEKAYYVNKIFLNYKSIDNLSDNSFLAIITNYLEISYNNINDYYYNLWLSLLIKNNNLKFNKLYNPIQISQINFGVINEELFDMSRSYFLNNYDLMLLYKDINISYTKLLYPNAIKFKLTK